MRRISDETSVERIEHKSKKNMALGTIIGYIAILVSVAHGLILTPLVMNATGAENYGLYGIATTIIFLFLLDFGLTTTTETYAAKLRAAGDKEGVQRFLSTVFKMYLILDSIFIAVVAILYFAAPYMYAKSYSPDQIQVLQYLLLIVGGYTLASLPTATFSSMITTYEKFGFNKFIDLIQKVAYFGATLAIIWASDNHLLTQYQVLIWVTAVNSLSFILAIVIRYFYMRFYLGVRLDLRLKVPKGELKKIFIFSAWGLVIAIGNRLVFNITPSILGMVSNDIEVTMFMLVNTIEGYVFMFGAMTGTFFMAKVARVEATGTKEEKIEKLQALAAKVGKLQFFVVAMILFGFATVGQEFIKFWLYDQIYTYNHPEFINIYWCILAICAYEIVRIPELPFYNAMLTEGHIRPIAINTIIKAIINISMSFVLSYFYGMVGACIAIAVARVLDLVLNNICYKKYLGISLRKFFSFIYIRGAISAGIAFGFGLLCHFLLPNIIQTGDFNLDHKIIFLISGIVFVSIFTICTFFISFTKKERLYYWDVILELLHIKKKNPAPVAVEEKPQEIEETKVEEEVHEEN